MAKSQPKASAAYFTVLPTIKHWSGYEFQQRGGRVYISLDGKEQDTISNNDLLRNEGLILTPTALRKLAVTWLTDNDAESLA